MMCRPNAWPSRARPGCASRLAAWATPSHSAFGGLREDPSLTPNMLRPALCIGFWSPRSCRQRCTKGRRESLEAVAPECACRRGKSSRQWPRRLTPSTPNIQVNALCIRLMMDLAVSGGTKAVVRRSRHKVDRPLCIATVRSLAHAHHKLGHGTYDGLVEDLDALLERLEVLVASGGLDASEDELGAQAPRLGDVELLGDRLVGCRGNEDTESQSTMPPDCLRREADAPTGL